MSGANDLVLIAHRAFYQAEMLHEMPEGIQIRPDHDRAVTAAVMAVEAEVRERIAQAIEAVDPIEWALFGQFAGQEAARIARHATP